jgi:hypothetical protein
MPGFQLQPIAQHDGFLLKANRGSEQYQAIKSSMANR